MSRPRKFLSRNVRGSRPVHAVAYDVRVDNVVDMLVTTCPDANQCQRERIHVRACTLDYTSSCGVSDPVGKTARVRRNTICPSMASILSVGVANQKTMIETLLLGSVPEELRAGDADSPFDDETAGCHQSRLNVPNEEGRSVGRMGTAFG